MSATVGMLQTFAKDSKWKPTAEKTEASRKILSDSSWADVYSPLAYFLAVVLLRPFVPSFLPPHDSCITMTEQMLMLTLSSSSGAPRHRRRLRDVLPHDHGLCQIHRRAWYISRWPLSPHAAPHPPPRRSGSRLGLLLHHPLRLRQFPQTHQTRQIWPNRERSVESISELL